MGLFSKKKNTIETPPIIPSPNTPQATQMPPTPLPQPTPEQNNQNIIPKQTIQQSTIETQKPTTPQPIQAIQATMPSTMIPSVTTEKNNSRTGSDEPFFIRIDKFNETKNNFSKIQHKIEEMQRVLDSLEQTKEQEDKEINEWNQDIKEMKGYLDAIDSDIFSRI